MIIKLIDYKKIDKIILIPHSMGGFIHFYLVNNYSDRISGYYLKNEYNCI